MKISFFLFFTLVSMWLWRNFIPFHTKCLSTTTLCLKFLLLSYLMSLLRSAVPFIKILFMIPQKCKSFLAFLSKWSSFECTKKKFIKIHFRCFSFNSPVCCINGVTKINPSLISWLLKKVLEWEWDCVCWKWCHVDLWLRNCLI